MLTAVITRFVRIRLHGIGRSSSVVTELLVW